MEYRYHILEEKEVYRGFFRITKYVLDYEYFSGGMSGPVIRECLGKNGKVVSALVYSPKDDSFVFVEQFRVGIMASGANPWNLEVVSGFMDKPDEPPETAMRRELNEEIGCEPNALLPIATYYGSPGSGGGQTHLFFATVDSENLKMFTGLHEEGEDICVHKMARTETLARLDAGKLDNATLIIALQYFKLHEKALLENIVNKHA